MRVPYLQGNNTQNNPAALPVSSMPARARTSLLLTTDMNQPQPGDSVQLARAATVPVSSAGDQRSLTRRILDNITGADLLAREINEQNPPLMIRVKKGREVKDLVKALLANPKAKLALYYPKTDSLDMGGLIRQALDKAAHFYLQPQQHIFIESNMPDSKIWASQPDLKNAIILGLICGKVLTEKMVIENRFSQPVFQQIHGGLQLIHQKLPFAKPELFIASITCSKKHILDALKYLEPETYSKPAMQEYALQSMTLAELQTLLTEHFSPALFVAYGISQVTDIAPESADKLRENLCGKDNLRDNFQKVDIELSSSTSDVNPVFEQWFSRLHQEASDEQLKNLCRTITGCSTFSPHINNITVRMTQLHKSDKLFYSHACFNKIDFNADIFKIFVQENNYSLFKILMLEQDEAFNAK